MSVTHAGETPESEELLEETLSSAPLVVGIGASAGGLKALQTFFKALPDAPDIIFVVIVHLSPEHESMMAELLQPHTKMRVVQVRNRIDVERDHVYVIPPGKRLVALDGFLDLADFDEPRGHRAPIDIFFRSLAENHGDGVAIIFSGTGSDGSLGIKAIKEAGGMLMVQDPDEAEYDGMPRNAIATGMVDVVLPVAGLAKELVAYRAGKRHIRLPIDNGDDELFPLAEQELLHKLLLTLRARTGHDFSQYKLPTLLRRIARRMQVHHLTELRDYLRLLRRDGKEVDLLFRDMLISVTSFFRDPDSFKGLEEQVIQQLYIGIEAGEAVRVWVVGCATGEEAYSIAMLLLEHAARLEHAPEMQIFATDLDEYALDVARRGIYPESIATDVSEERLKRFFTKLNGHYQIRSEVRERVLFATHSLLKDPPFSKLDLISCRNLLIYLQSGLQQQIFELFSYALRPAGYLFLGNTESIDRAVPFFHTLDKQHHLYQQRPQTGIHPHLPALPLTVITTQRQIIEIPTPDVTRPKNSLTEQHERLLEALAPPSLLVDANYNILHLSESAGRFLLPPGGPWISDVTQLVLPEMQFELRSSFYQVFERGKASVTTPIWVQLHDEPRLIYMTVSSRHGEGKEALALVIFVEDDNAEAPLKAADVDDSEVKGNLKRLEDELNYAQQRLQILSEEHTSSHEELRAANEELQSINEEYKSTLEELETSKEELQSINEELQTTNQELKAKVEEVSLAHGDLQNLLAATDIATLFLDRKLCILRYTPRAAELFNLMPNDRGRPLAHLRSKIEYPWLEVDAQTVLSDLVTVERELQAIDGKWYLVRLRPYRSVNDHISGVVLVLIDITSRKEMEEEIQHAKEYAERIVRTVREPLVVLRPNLRVDSANEAFYKMFQLEHEQVEGQLFYELENHQWDRPELRILLEEVLPEDHAFTDFMLENDFDRIGQRTMLFNGSRLSHSQLILLAIEDITERQQAMQSLVRLNRELEDRSWQVRLLAAELSLAEQRERHRIAQILHDNLQQLLYSMQVQIHLLRTELVPSSQEVFDLFQNAVAEAIRTTRTLTVELSPPILQGEGLVEAIQWLAAQMHELHGLTVTLQTEGDLPILEEGVRILLFQTVRELLFNIVKHAETRHANVILRQEGGQFVVVVADQGVGFVSESNGKKGTGLGLRTIRERLLLFEGHLEINSQLGVGTEATVSLPILQPAE